MLAPSSTRLLRVYLRPLRGRVALLAALLLAVTALQLANPQIVRFLLDTAQAGGAPAALAGAAALFLAVALVTQVAGVAEAYCAADLGWRAANALRLDLARHCLGLDLRFHEAHTPGALIARVDGDVSTLANFLSRFLLLVAGSLLLLVGVVALVFREDPRLGLLLLLISAAGLGISLWVRGFTARYALAQRQAVADLEGFVEERLGALPDVRANAMQPHVLYRLGLALREVYERARTMVVAGQALGWVTGATSLLTAVVTLAAGAVLYARGEATLGTVYLLFQYQALLRRPIGEITRQLQDFQRAGAAAVRVRQLLDAAPAVRDGPGAPLPEGPLGVELRGVTFSYLAAGAPVALRDLSVRVEPGTSLGLLGRTGSGKSTLTRLLLRLYDPQAGAVLLGGVDLRALRLERLRREVAMVTQEVQLFRTTVRENLTLFDPTVPDGAILDVLEGLGLLPWLERRPRGLDTIIGPGGAGTAGEDGGLSAGEAQLLAFGRVFLRDPRVVILDEASSRLDPATEGLIRTAVDRLLADRTAVVVAHRLETVERVTDLLVLDGGRVAEHGPRARLAAEPQSRYAALLRDGVAPERLA